MNAHITGNDLKQKGTKINIGDKEYEIAMDFNVICELEEHYGSMDKVEAALSKSKMKDVRFILYAMLKQSDESLTEKQVGHMITVQNMQQIMDALGKAMQSAIPEADDDGKNIKSPQEA